MMQDSQMQIATGCLVVSLVFCSVGWGVGLYTKWDRVNQWIGSSTPAAGAQEAAALTEKFPQETAGAVLLRRPLHAAESLRDLYELAEERGVDETELRENVESAREQSEEYLGFDATKPKEWKSTGLDLEDPIAAGIFAEEDDAEPRAVLVLATVDDKSDLEDFLTDIPEDDDYDTEEISGTEVKSLESLHLAYDGDLAYILTADPDGWDDPKKRLVDLMEAPDSGESLADLEGFEDFEEALLNEEMVAAFINTEAESFDSVFDEASDEMEEDSGLDAEQLETMREHVTGFGFGGSADSESLEVRYRMWAGLDAAGRDAADRLLAPERSITWQQFATEKTTGALRLSIRPDALWEESKESLSSDGEEQLDQASEALEAQAGTDVDVEEDLIGALSGDAGLVVYDMSNVIGDDGSFRWGGLLSVKFIGLLQFKESSGLDNLLEKAKEALNNQQMGTNPELRELETDQGETVDSIRVLDLGNPMFPKLYAEDALLAVAPASMSEDSVRSYLEGTRSETSLADAEGVDLGNRFATENNLNGVYLNFSQIQDSLGESLAESGDFANFLEVWREGAFTGYVNEKGAFLDMRGRLREASD